MSTSTVALDRAYLLDWYRRNRERSASIFALIDEASYTQRPIALRHPFVFYEGHLPAFSFLTLNERGLGEAPLDPTLEKLFERGIDPSSPDAAHAHERSSWPERAAIEAFSNACDERVRAALATAELAQDRLPSLVRGEAAYTILEHEQMHHETLMYIVNQLDYAHKGRIAQEHHDHTAPRNDFLSIDAGIATLGAERDALAFRLGQRVRSA